MRSLYLVNVSIPTLYNRLSHLGDTYYPRNKGRQAVYELWKNETVKPEELLEALKTIRPVEPLKEFFLVSRERVASYPQFFSKESQPKVIIGPKDCDIRSLIEIQDNIYLKGEVEDPFYRERREKYFIVTVDCPEPQDTCFCTSIGGKPYSIWGGDLNISFGDEGLLIDILSSKGEQFIEKASTLFTEIPEKELKRREKFRSDAERNLSKINSSEFPNDLDKRVEKQMDTKFWSKVLENCVDCQACERICPTCYCFLLYDTPSDKGFNRIKVLDFCYHAAYGRVGGGANPLAHFSHRLRNRFECKFMSFPRNFKVIACTGCGRCISACSGKIDIRKVLGAL